MFGPHFTLSDPLLDRIVMLTHFSQLSSSGDLKDQTGWRRSAQYGPAIMNIIHKIYPVRETTESFPPPPSIPLATAPDSESSHQPPAPSRPTKRPRHCKTCGSSSHICTWLFLLHTNSYAVCANTASNQLCPQWLTRGNENKPVDMSLIPSELSQCPRQCGACKGFGHIASNQVSPKWVPKEQRQAQRHPGLQNEGNPVFVNVSNVLDIDGHL